MLWEKNPWKKLYIVFTPKDKVIVMGSTVNQNLNELDSIASVVNSENFVNLDPNIQNKIIDTMHNDKEKGGGLIGKLLGNKLINASINMSFIICILFIIIMIIDLIHSYCVNENINMDLINIIVPVIMTSIGYIFGKGVNWTIALHN